MPKKIKKFADDGWAIWIDGEDTSTVYLNYWVNPRGNSYVDFSVKIKSIKGTKNLNVYIPFFVRPSELEDISLKFNDERIARAVFSSGCIVDYKKNKFTSEIAYNGRTMDLIHLEDFVYGVEWIGAGTLIKIDYQRLLPYIENNEGYFAFRIPHKSLDEVFSTYSSLRSLLRRIREMLTTPILSEKYGYSVRINESRLLPSEIGRKGGFIRQKLQKAVVTVSIREDYEISDSNCYRIRRLEEDLYKDFVPKDFKCDNVITYQWNESREKNLRGHFSFYFDITRNAVSKSSMLTYLVLLVFFGAMGNALWDLIKFFLGIF